MDLHGRTERTERTHGCTDGRAGEAIRRNTWTTRTHLHTCTLVCRKHLKGNLLCACRDSIKLHLDLGLGEVVDTAYRRYIECITQMDRRREDAVIDFCSTTNSVIKRSGQ